jgi:hypothetical protein
MWPLCGPDDQDEAHGWPGGTSAMLSAFGSDIRINMEML